MKTIHRFHKTKLVVLVSALLLSAKVWSGAADFGDTLPPVLASGFESWGKGVAVEEILGGWQRGGLMEGSTKAATQSTYFRNLGMTLGNYKSCELLETRRIGRKSQILYVAVNFSRAAVYARFLIYRTEQNWVVQSMDFNERPEAIMPWLALAGEQSTE